MSTIITLPHGGNKASFEIEDLVKYFQDKKLHFMVIGSSRVSYSKHKKKQSLDVWLRKYGAKGIAKDTCQSVNSVIKQIVSTGFFMLEIRKCPTTQRNCKALIYVAK
jgi:carbamoylphosphate synthase small subunit